MLLRETVLSITYLNMGIIPMNWWGVGEALNSLPDEDRGQAKRKFRKAWRCAAAKFEPDCRNVRHSPRKKKRLVRRLANAYADSIIERFEAGQKF